MAVDFQSAYEGSFQLDLDEERYRLLRIAVRNRVADAAVGNFQLTREESDALTGFMERATRQPDTIRGSNKTLPYYVNSLLSASGLEPDELACAIDTAEQMRAHQLGFNLLEEIPNDVASIT